MSDETQRPDAMNILDSLPEIKAPKELKDAVAVALKHDRESRQAPRVTASGKGAIAEQILQLAFANGVKVREDADLAEVLSKLELDSPIPLEAYAAVAEILAYLYRANAAQQRSRSHE